MCVPHKNTIKTVQFMHTPLVGTVDDVRNVESVGHQ